MLPDDRWIGGLIIAIGLATLVFDVRVERGHVGVGSPASLQGRLVRMWPQLMMLVGAFIFTFGIYFYVNQNAPTSATPSVDAAPLSDAPSEPTKPSVAELDEDEQLIANWQARRAPLEVAARNIRGTPAQCGGDRYQCTLAIVGGDKTYNLQVGLATPVAMQIHLQGQGIKRFRILRILKESPIDIRKVREFKEDTGFDIGQRAFLEMDDGNVIQIVPVGILYPSIDGRNEIRVKYQVYTNGEYLIDPL